MALFEDRVFVLFVTFDEIPPILALILVKKKVIRRELERIVCQFCFVNRRKLLFLEDEKKSYV